MGMKGINPLEAHCEKVVVGLAGAVLVGIVVWQFAGPRPKVRIGGAEYELTESYGVLERRATLIDGQIKGPGSPESLPAADMPLGLLADAGDFSTTSVAPAKALAIAFGTAGIPVEGVGAIAPDGQGTRFAEVVPPAPSKPTAAQVAATLHPQELAINDGLAAFVAEPNRPDMVAVSVETVWSGSDLLTMLQNDPDGPEGPIEPLPSVWWNGPDMTIFDGELLRQKLQEDGSWGEEETVTLMPGRLELRAEMAEAGQEAMTVDQMRQWAGEATEFAEEIRRPRFYSIVFGDDWVPPTEVDPMAGAQAADPEEAKLRRQLEGCQRRIANIEAALADLGGGARQEGGRPGGHDRPPPKDDAEGNDRKRQNLERELENQRELEQEIIDRLIDMGAKNIPGAEQAAPMANEPAMPSEAEVDPPLLEADEIRIWAHDVNVERGATYRYKMRVWVTNPFFGHDAGLVEEQKALGASPLLASEASEWTDDVHVHDEAYYFITSAQEGGLGAAGARAMASVFVFRWGYWREGKARMEPGDALATNVQSPMLGEVLARIELPETPEQQRPDGGHGGHMAPGGAQEDAPELGPEVEYEPIPVTRDVVLLDVGPSVNANGETVAYLREETGAIVNRDPEAESRKQIFMVVQGSAQRGEEALKPKEMAAPPRGPRPEPAPRPGQRDPDSPMSPTSPSGPGGG